MIYFNLKVSLLKVIRLFTLMPETTIAERISTPLTLSSVLILIHGAVYFYSVDRWMDK